MPKTKSTLIPTLVYVGTRLSLTTNPDPCGSGLRYKKCCKKKDAQRGREKKLEELRPDTAVDVRDMTANLTAIVI